MCVGLCLLAEFLLTDMCFCKMCACLCVLVPVCVWADTADQAAYARARALKDTQSAQCLSQQPANQIP